MTTAMHEYLVPLTGISMPHKKRSNEHMAFSTMALLVFLVEHTLMKQSRAKEREMDLVDKLIGFSCAAMCAHHHLVKPEMLIIPIDMTILGHGPCTIFLVLQSNKHLQGMNGLLHYIPDLNSIWRKIQHQSVAGVHAKHIVSNMDSPLLMDFIMFLMWLANHRRDLWELFGHNAMMSCLRCITTLSEIYLVETVVRSRLEHAPLPLLKGRKGTHRNTHPAAKSAWIKLTRLAKFTNNNITQVLTRTTLPKGLQQLFEHACVVSYFNTVKITFAGVRRLHLSMDASNHTEDTMVTAVYSPSNNFAAYASIVVLQHPTLGDLDIDDLKTLAAEGKLTRMSAFNHIKALHQVLQSLGQNLEHYKLPTNVIARPLYSHESRYEFATKWWIWDKHTQTSAPQVPASLTWASMPLLVTCIDQASTGLAAMQFLMESNGVMMLQYFDKYHRVSPPPNNPQHVNPTP